MPERVDVVRDAPRLAHREGALAGSLYRRAVKADAVQLWWGPSMVSLPRMPAEGRDPVRPRARAQVPTMFGSYVCQPGGGASGSLDALHPPALRVSGSTRSSSTA